MAIDKEAMRAAFNAGWAAANISLAETMEQGGHREQGRLLRILAGQPPRVEVGDLSTPEGQAMRSGSEVVFREVVKRADPRAKGNGSP